MSGTVTPGGTQHWTANTELNGVPGTPTVLTLTVTDPGGNTVAGFPIALGGFGTTGTGQYYYDWLTLVSAITGTYTATWAGTLNGLPINATDTVEVGVGGAYADLATFRQYLRTNAVATDSLDPDSNLEQLALDAAARAIERSTGRFFTTSTGTVTSRYFTPDAIRTNYFGRYIVQIDDVADGTSMVVDWDSTGNGDYTNNIASTLWRLGPADNPTRGLPYDRLIFNIGTWIPVYGEQAVRVQALWGWASTPNVVISANLLQAARYIKRRDAPFGVTESPTATQQTRLLPVLDPDVELMLNVYRRMLVG